MSEPLKVDVEALIVGAGPVGLALACELTRHGVGCRVVDKSEGPTDQSRALGLQARTLEVFENIGVIDRVLEEGRRVHGIGAYSKGERIVHIRFEPDEMETPYPFITILPQARTERILLERLARYEKAVERKTELKGLTQDADGVSAELMKAGGELERVRARWLLGCDGAGSVVRHALDVKFEGSEYPELYLLADVRLDWDVSDVEARVILLDDGGGIAAFPLPEKGRWRLVDASGRSEGDRPEQIVGRFQTLLEANGHPGITIDEVTWTSAFRLHRRIASKFRDGRCFLLGDAAHIHSPAGGQGLNTGVQDAYNLAWKLGLAAAGDAPETILDSFDAERRPVASGVLKGSDLATRVMGLKNPLAESLRNTLASHLSGFDFVRQRVARSVSEIEVEYRDSPIVEKATGTLWRALTHPSQVLPFRNAPHAGDRAPDVTLEAGNPGRLFDLLRGPGHVLLLFEGLNPTEQGKRRIAAIGERVSRAYGERIKVVVVGNDARAAKGDVAYVEDRAGMLQTRYGAEVESLYLIRPDGYVATRSQPADGDGLDAFLRRIFQARKGSGPA